MSGAIHPGAAHDLPALERQLREEMRLFAYPEQAWVVAREPSPGAARHVDVLIIGAGQAGITAAAHLQRQRIHDVVLVDRKPAGLEGPWSDWARMSTLRSPKELHGPDAGWPSATFERWFVALHGQDAYDGLTFIPKTDWHAYLSWLRSQYGLEAHNDTEVVGLEYRADRWHVSLRARGGAGRERWEARWEARKVVFATGLDGLGGIRVPSFIEGLPRELWYLATEHIPDEALRGAAIGVLGGGATGFDNAAHAAERGAQRVVQFQRSPAAQQSVPLRSIEYTGLFQNWRTAPDDTKRRLAKRFMRSSVPAPEHTIARCRANAAYELREGEAWTSALPTADGRVRVTSPGGEYVFDRLIVCTGFRVDLASQPYLHAVSQMVETWGQRFGWAPDEEPQLATFPFLDPGFRAQPRRPEDARAVRALHFFSLAAEPSLGPIASTINGLPWGGRVLAEAISEDLFHDDIDTHLSRFEAFEG